MNIRWIKDEDRKPDDIRGPWMISQIIHFYDVLYQIHISKDNAGFYTLCIISSTKENIDLQVNDIPMSKYDDSSILVFAHKVFEIYLIHYDELMECKK